MIFKLKNSLFFAVLFVFLVAFTARLNTPIYLERPDGWPEVHYDLSKNPLSEDGFLLGRKLFYDPVLSRDSTISCSTCHIQQNAFTQIDHSLSHGVDGKFGTRNSLSLQNLAWSKNFMWDGGVNHLDVQPLNPITNPVEMDENLEHVIEKLKKNADYSFLFQRAFGDSDITGQRVLKSLSQFMLMLQSTNAKFDKVMRNELYFSDEELKGYQLFTRNCAVCHSEPLFASDKFENNGLPVDPYFNDNGRASITNKKEDRLRFKVPTLRNIQVTGPYMHDGRFNTLKEVINHYNTINFSKDVSMELKKMSKFSDEDQLYLIAFLKTLTDNEFLYDERFSYPK